MVYENNKIETEYKWNQSNIMDIKSMLGTNHRHPLLHMAKSYTWLEEKNQSIHEFSIEYMMNSNFNTHKFFREKVKACLKNTFSTSTMTNISKILLKPNTRVLALVMFYENRKNSNKIFRVLSCVIYNIISKYVCIDYFGYEMFYDDI